MVYGIVLPILFLQLVTAHLCLACMADGSNAPLSPCRSLPRLVSLPAGLSSPYPWRIHGAGIYPNMTGVYWWDPWHTIYSSTMDPSWAIDSPELMTTGLPALCPGWTLPGHHQDTRRTLASRAPERIIIKDPWIKSRLQSVSFWLIQFNPDGSVSKPCTPGEHQNSW